jgi:hypothetical protein
VNKMAIWKEMLVIHGKYHMLPYFLEIKKRFFLVYIMLHPESFVFVQAAMFRELPLFVGQRHVWIHLGCFYAYLLSFGELSPHVLWFDLLLPGNWFYQLVKEHSAIPMWSLAEFNKSDKSYAHFSVFSWSDTFLFTYRYINTWYQMQFLEKSISCFDLLVILLKKAFFIRYTGSCFYTNIYQACIIVCLCQCCFDIWIYIYIYTKLFSVYTIDHQVCSVCILFELYVYPVME